MKKTSFDTKRVFKKSLAIELLGKGCTLVDITPNKDKPHLDVYVFQNNLFLKEALSELTK